VGERLDAHHFVNFTIKLVTVPIDNGNEAIQFVMSRRHCRFPNLTFLHFAITEHRKDREVFSCQLPGQRHTRTVRQSVPDRAGAEINTGYPRHIWVITEGTAQARVCIQLLCIEIAEIGEYREDPHSCVTFSDHEPVPIRMVRKSRGNPHHRVVQHRQSLSCREHRAVVPSLRDLNQPNRLCPYEHRLVLQICLQLCRPHTYRVAPRPREHSRSSALGACLMKIRLLIDCHLVLHTANRSAPIQIISLWTQYLPFNNSFTSSMRHPDKSSFPGHAYESPATGNPEQGFRDLIDDLGRPPRRRACE